MPVMELDAAAHLVDRCLRTLDAMFSDSVINVDTSTGNASRLCKLDGTTARSIGTGATASKAPNRSVSTSFDLQQWIDTHNLAVHGPKPWNGGTLWTFQTCPFNAEHRNRSAFVGRLSNGAVIAGCHHNGRGGKDWHALRDLIEPGWRTSSPDGGTSNPHPIGECEPPIPFDQFNLPPLPVEVFPLWLRRFVEAQAVATQTPLDLTAMLVLSVLAAACGKKLRIQAKGRVPKTSEHLHRYGSQNQITPSLASIWRPNRVVSSVFFSVRRRCK